MPDIRHDGRAKLIENSGAGFKRNEIVCRVVKVAKRGASQAAGQPSARRVMGDTLQAAHNPSVRTARPYVEHRACRLAGVRFGNPSVTFAGYPAPWSSGSHLRPCLLAPSDRRVPRTITPPLKQKRCPCARWRHKGESTILRRRHLPSCTTGINTSEHYISMLKFLISKSKPKPRAEAGLESSACMVEVLERL